MEREAKGSVCVTGGTGYVASWLIMRLLQEGYTVHTTTRSNTECKRDVSYLTNLPGASERLKIFNADLDKPESFEAPISGCIGVFHVAHPLDVEGKEPQEKLNQITINGTIGVLQACVNAKTVKRVVHTSSCSTVVFNGKQDMGEVDEESWSDVDVIQANYARNGAPYFISKTVTERAATEFAEKNGLDLVTINPTYIHGPFICPSFPLSVRLSMAMIFGDQDYVALLTNFQMVHVDDVATAHIFLLEYPGAKGRYICSRLEMPLAKMVEFLSDRYPEFQIRKTDYLNAIPGPKYSSPTSKKLLDTGFKFKYGLEEMFDEAIECCRKKGLL